MRLITGLCTLLCAVSLHAAQRPNLQQEVMDMRHIIGGMRNQVDNHDAEIVVFQERLNNQEITLEQIRSEMTFLKREATENQAQSLDKLDANLGSLISDVKQMRNHANGLSETLAKTQSRVEELNNTVQAQNRNIHNLHSALATIMEAFDMKPPAGISTETADTYKVKAGDSLDKIARKYKTSIKKIKELNRLKNDTIRVGQKLKVEASQK